VGLAHRPAAALAADEAGLRDAIWAMLSERPVGRGAVGRAGVSSAHPLASAAGVEVLALGGNVVDAAVAVSFALGVVEPDASGIGGYGEMLIHTMALAEPTAIEFSTRLPAAATPGNPAVDTLPRSGAGVAIVPGTVAGMELAWQRYGSGRVAWARLLEPAIRLAENGFPVSDGFATTLRRERPSFEASPAALALYYPDGQPLATGDTLRNPDLAWTLRQIAGHGAAAFYRGAVAERLVADLAAGGNVMTLADLADYTAVERRPVRGSYRGNDVYSGPPPITGGVQLVARLNLLELTDPGTSMTEDPTTLHALIEAWKAQPGTGGRVGDPDIWPVDLSPFESKDSAQARWRCFDPSRASAPGALTQENCGRTETAPPEDGAAAEECLAVDRECRGSGTTAFVVADADGNIVSVTQTLGTWGGNFHVSPGLGFLYNDKLRSYGSNPDAVNSRRPGARTTTIITPTIVFRGSGPERRAWFGAGAAGNAWISAAVYQTVAGIVDHGLTAQQALELPRILGGGRVMQVEDGFSPAMLRELERMGHAFQPISLLGELRMGYGAAVLVGDGWVEAAGDPRRSGHGAVVPATGGH
jgi:gamma-glutamyltranspeptidase